MAVCRSDLTCMREYLCIKWTRKITDAIVLITRSISSLLLYFTVRYVRVLYLTFPGSS